MLLFKHYHVQPILKKIKIATRRMGHKRWKINSVHEAKTDYTAEGRFGKIKVTEEPYQQKLSMMTPKDAQAEGGYTIHDCCKEKNIDRIYVRTICKKCKHAKTCFQIVWVNINGVWNPDITPWVVWFELVEEVSQQQPVHPTSRLRYYNTTFI